MKEAQECPDSCSLLYADEKCDVQCNTGGFLIHFVTLGIIRNRLEATVFSVMLTRCKLGIKVYGRFQAIQNDS